MLFSLLEMIWWLQPEASGAGANGPAGGASGGAPPNGCMMNLAMLAPLMLIFYFMLIRPQQKRQKEHDAMLKAVRRGTMVRTTGGIRGEVTDSNDRDVTLLIADKVKINVLRSHIAGLEVEAQAGDKTASTSEKKD